MSKTILVVQSSPRTAEDRDAYNDWYENTHIPEMLNLDGFSAARRYEAPDGASYLAVYDIDSDLEDAKAVMTASLPTMSQPVGVRLDPPPSVQYFRLVGEFPAAGG